MTLSILSAPSLILFVLKTFLFYVHIFFPCQICKKQKGKKSNVAKHCDMQHVRRKILPCISQVSPKGLQRKAKIPRVALQVRQATYILLPVIVNVLAGEGYSYSLRALFCLTTILLNGRLTRLDWLFAV